MIYKFIWLLRTLFYAPFFKEFSFPSYIGKPIFTGGLKRVTVKKRVRIFPGLRIETHQNGEIIINKNVAIGQNLHITSAKEKLTIGSNTTILGNVFITNIDHDYKQINVHVLKQKMIVQNTIIGDNCFIGYGAAIQAGTILGKQCVVGAHSVVRGVFPDYCVIVGAPAKIVKKYDIILNIWRKTTSKGDFIND